MKTLLEDISRRKDFPIFEGTNEQISKWVEMNLDVFNLNEKSSCQVWLDKPLNTIEISGDEDFKILEIIKVETIKL